MRITVWIILVTLNLLPHLGCSYETETGYKTYKFKVEDADTIFTVTQALLFDASHKVMQDSFPDYFDNDGLSMPATVDLNYLINKGYLVIIPKNPYTGEDVKQSEEYSPGDVYFKFNFFEGGEFKIHYGKGAHRYQPEKYVKGEVKETWIPFNPKSEEQLLFSSYDGRTVTHFIPGFNMVKDEIDDQPPPDTFTDRTKLEDAKQRMYFIKRQMGDIFRNASSIAEQPGDTLTDTISIFGRINPAAWINPYTGMPMKEVQCSVRYIYGINKVKDPDKEEYAGNYSYVKSLAGGGIRGVLELYYINDDGRLGTYNCGTRSGGK